MRKTTAAPKKPTDAKLRASTSPLTTAFDDAILSPIKEEDVQLPEVQGSGNTTSLTTGMEPFSDQQKDYFKSCLEDAQYRMENERRLERTGYEETIAHMKGQMDEMREDYLDLRRSRSSPVAEITSQRHAFETPKVQRPQDKAYQEILTASKEQLHAHDPKPQSFRQYETDPGVHDQNEMMKIYDIRMNNLMTSMGSILKYSKKEDTTELPKFQGGDSQWPKWYQLLRAYLQARGWLPTFDHPIGPSTHGRPTPDFDTDINSLIYQKTSSKMF